MRSSHFFEIEKTPAGISECLSKTTKTLSEFGVSKSTGMKFAMYLEELLMYITGPDFKTEETVSLKIVKWLDQVSIRIRLKGQEISLEKFRHLDKASQGDFLEMEEEELDQHLNSILLSAGMENISTRYKSGTNEFVLYVKRSHYGLLFKVIGAMILGIGAGVLMKKFLSQDVQSYIGTNIFGSVSHMFMAAIKMMIGPMIFCSIALCVSSYSDFSLLKKVGKRTLLHYLFNALVGIGLAVGICAIFKPGVTGQAMDFSFVASEVQKEAVEVNIWKTIADIVPSNMFRSFADSVILQIIFIAVLFGIAISRTGKTSLVVRDNIKGLDRIFSKMTSFVMNFLPLMVFCSMANMALSIGLETVVLILYWILLIFVAYIIMIFVYALMVWIVAKTNPITFFKKVITSLLISFSMGSSSAAMSTTLATCEKDLKIKQNVFSFSVPLGVSIHSASSCIFYVLSVVFLNNLFTGTDCLAQLGPLFYFSVFMLALGAPSVSGAGPICVGTLLVSLHAPMGCIALIIAWDPLVSTIKTACSSMEDLSVAYMVDHELREKE